MQLEVVDDVGGDGEGGRTEPREARAWQAREDRRPVSGDLQVGGRVEVVTLGVAGRGGDVGHDDGRLTRHLGERGQRLALIARARRSGDVDVEELRDVDEPAGDAVARDQRGLVGGARQDVGRRARAGGRVELQLHDRGAEVGARVGVRVGERADVGHDVKPAGPVAAHVHRIGAQRRRPAKPARTVGRGVAHLRRAAAADTGGRQRARLAGSHAVAVVGAQVGRAGAVGILAAVERAVGRQPRPVRKDDERRPGEVGEEDRLGGERRCTPADAVGPEMRRRPIGRAGHEHQVGGLVSGHGRRERHVHGRRLAGAEIQLRRAHGEGTRVRGRRRQCPADLQADLQLTRGIRRDVADRHRQGGARARRDRAELEWAGGFDLQGPGGAPRVQRRAGEHRLVRAGGLLPVAHGQPDRQVGRGIGKHVRRVGLVRGGPVAEVPVIGQQIEVRVGAATAGELYGDPREHDVRPAEPCDRRLIERRHCPEAHAVHVAKPFRPPAFGGDRHGADFEAEVIHRTSVRFDRRLLAERAVGAGDRNETRRMKRLRVRPAVEEDDDVDEGVRGRAPPDRRRGDADQVVAAVPPRAGGRRRQRGQDGEQQHGEPAHGRGRVRDRPALGN